MLSWEIIGEAPRQTFTARYRGVTGHIVTEPNGLTVWTSGPDGAVMPPDVVEGLAGEQAIEAARAWVRSCLGFVCDGRGCTARGCACSDAPAPASAPVPAAAPASAPVVDPPRRRPPRRHKGLASALRAARLEARPIVEEEEGRLSGGRGKPDRLWYYAKTEQVLGEARRVLALHGLELEWVGFRFVEHDRIRSTWRLRHVSGESRLYRWTAPMFTDAPTATHAVLGTVRHAERSIHLLVLQIPLVDTPATGDVIKHSVIVKRASPADAERAELDRITGPAPSWLDGGRRP